MKKEKPKSAIAKLLDSVSNLTIIEGADVGVAQTFDETQKKEDTIKSTPNQKPLEKHTHIVTLKYLDVNHCRPWMFADRPENEMGDINSLSESIKITGQQEPILVRPTDNEKKEQYEIIFGHRRWRACKKIGTKVLAIIKAVTDREASLFQKEENENRKDLSDFAKAKSFKAQIEAEIFKNESDLSKHLGISRQSLNDIMSFNRIPELLIEAIPDIKSISRKTAVKLSVLACNRKILEHLLVLAKKIGDKKITAANIDAHLEKIIDPKSTEKQSNLMKITDKLGNKLFSMRQTHQGEVIIKIDKKLYGQYEINRIKDVIFTCLSKSE